MGEKMKKALFTLVLTAALAVPALTENLVPNGDFRQFDPQTGKPAGWVSIRWNEVVEEGPGVTPVLRMCSYYRSKTGGWKGNAAVVIPKMPAGKYRFRLKTRGSANQLYFFLIPPKNSGLKTITVNCRKNSMTPLADHWRSGEYTVFLPSDLTGVRLTLEGFFAEPGEYEYLADLKIEPVK